ncbi:substrate-binding domain-containing protein, partial [Arthrobacter sp. Hiyo1]|uniref:substrate-binding domain-containing protein n=1 Tax=Arthrobacter sp. Hiyo1 TaxID=1588020 RepID=UPI00209C2462
MLTPAAFRADPRSRGQRTAGRDQWRGGARRTGAHGGRRGNPPSVEHLYALGHRKLAYIPGPASSWANSQRRAAITRFCADWGIELVTVGNQNATVDGGLAAAASVVASGATAVIAYNDLVAIGML